MLDIGTTSTRVISEETIFLGPTEIALPFWKFLMTLCLDVTQVLELSV